MDRRELEIMAPAGSWESLSAALKAGADSIYFGVESLNMRAHILGTDGNETMAVCFPNFRTSYIFSQHSHNV